MKSEVVSLNVTANTSGNTLNLEIAKNEAAWTASVAYHEMAEIPVREVDLFESVEDNLHHLEELQARLRFMMKEVKYLLKL